MALYQLPKAAINTLRLTIKGAPSQPSTSILPMVMEQFLDRLADPSPSHHVLRAPFIRPLLNKKASEKPLFGLLSTLYQPEPEHLEPDSPLQKQLIEFFEEKKYTLLMHSSIEEDLPVFVYCIHRKRLLGAPELVFNDAYNTALINSGKHQSIIHAISVLSHQFSLMLQAQADPLFKVATSRRPSDVDSSKGANPIRRAAYTDFQLEKRGGDWQIAGCLQSDVRGESNKSPSNDIPYYRPRLLDQRVITSWATAWNKNQYNPDVANLSFFTMENTVPWESVVDMIPKRVGKGDEAKTILVAPKTTRKVAFIPAPTSEEMEPIKPTGKNVTRELEPEENLGNWEKGPAVLRMHRQRAYWIDKLSSADLDQLGEGESPSHLPHMNQPPRRSNRAHQPTDSGSSYPRRRTTGANSQAVNQGSRKWGVPSESSETSSTTSQSGWTPRERQAPPSRPSRTFGEVKPSGQGRRFGGS